MPDTNEQGSNPPPTGDTQSKPTSQPASESTLKDILDTMHDSDFFPCTEQDAPSRFWSAYERVANQHDDEFLERHNGDMDVLLIFAGLFSGISSAFVLNTDSNLSPNPLDTTNTLLKILINTMGNDIFPAQEAALPVWTGPSSTTVWIQTLGYMSLSTSLLSAFGAVLAKQWLGNFKTSRFGKGALHERCQRRQQKFNELEASHFSIIISILPILLQLSLLFYGIALAATIWTQQHTIASVIMATAAFGFLFYIFTMVLSLKSPDCPFQTPVSILLRSIKKKVPTVVQRVLQGTAALQEVVRMKWEERPTSWEGFLYNLQQSSTRILHTVMDKITQLIMRLVSHLPTALRCRVPSAHDPMGGATSSAEAVGEQTISAKDLDLDSPESHAKAQAYAVQSTAVQWILETTTDTDIITTAARMIPEVEWPGKEDVTNVLDRLKGHFYACFDPTHEILPPAQARAVACLKAISHFSVEHDLKNSFSICRDGTIYPKDYYPKYRMLPDHDFLVVCSAISYGSDKLDIATINLSDRMWMARMFAYHLQKGVHLPDQMASMIGFIVACLKAESPAHLVANCLLLAGQLVGLRIEQRYLARIDKSKAIETLREFVMNRTLGVLLGKLRGLEWDQNAWKLIRPLLQDFDRSHESKSYSVKLPAPVKPPTPIELSTSKKSLKFCFNLLGEGPGTEDDDKVLFRTVAILIRIIKRTPRADPSGWYTPTQFDLLVDYLIRICEDIDYDAIADTFDVLTWLGGSPSTLELKRCYIETMVRFMRQDTTRDVALRAVCAIGIDVASLGQDNESFREHFSTALVSAVLLESPATQQASPNTNPFKNPSFFKPLRDIPYLRLVCTLSQDPTWRLQLYRSGHFNNILAITGTLPFLGDHDFDAYAVPVMHISAIIYASAEEHLFEHSFVHTIKVPPRWPLILRAWRYIFNLHGVFGGQDIPFPWQPSTKDGINALPHLVEYARRCGDNREEPLMAMVKQVCHKLYEQQQACKEGEAQRIQEGGSFGYRGIPALGDQIRKQIR